MSEKEETSLVFQLHKGNAASFSALFEKHAPHVYGFSFSLLKNKLDAEGVVQEVFLRIWQKRAEVDPEKSFKSYLFKIAYHISIDLLRERLKNRDYIRHLEQHYSQQPATFSPLAERNIIQGQIEAIIDTLPEKRREIFILSRYSGFSNREISERMNISVKTVENQITLSLKKIRRVLGAEILPTLLVFLLPFWGVS